MDALAGVFGKDTSPPPTPVDATGLPVPSSPANTTGTTGAPAQPIAGDAKPAPEKKRDFWSRVFGGGGKKEQDKKEEDRKKDEQKKKSGG